jgi:hypothetical protein
LAAGFQQPAVGFQYGIQTNDSFQWAVVGEPIFIAGGGKYTVFATPAPPYTTLSVTNDGGPGNTFPGNFIAATGDPAQVTPTGRDGVVGDPGLPGAPGTPGPAGIIEVVNTIPVAAPLPNKTFVIYTDNTFNPTIITGYSWNGSWSPAVNLTPAAGSQIFSTVGTPGSGTGNNGDWAFDSTSLDVYYKVAGSWTNPFTLAATFTQVANNSGGDMGPVPVRTPSVVGFDPLAVNFTVGPGTYTLDLQYQGFAISADKNIDLAWSDTSFNYHGVWEVQIKNVDGASSIDIDIVAGAWAENASLGLAFPITLAAGDIQVFVLRKPMTGARMIIENTYLLSNLP